MAAEAPPLTAEGGPRWLLGSAPDDCWGAAPWLQGAPPWLLGSGPMATKAFLIAARQHRQSLAAPDGCGNGRSLLGAPAIAAKAPRWPLKGRRPRSLLGSAPDHLAAPMATRGRPRWLVGSAPVAARAALTATTRQSPCEQNEDSAQQK